MLKERDNKAVYLFAEGKSEQKIISANYQCAKKLLEAPHNNLVQILGVSNNDRVSLTVEEYIQGGNLTERLVHGMDLQSFLFQAIQLCDVLSAMASKNIFHGDLTEKTVFYSGDGLIKITDFAVLARHEKDKQRALLKDMVAGAKLFSVMLNGKTEQEFSPTILKKLPAELQPVFNAMLDQSSKYSWLSIKVMLQDLQQGMTTEVLENRVKKATPCWKKRVLVWSLMFLLTVTALGLFWHFYLQL